MNDHPFIFSNSKKYRVRRHLVFWLFWWIFQGFLYSFIYLDEQFQNYGMRLVDSMIESLIFLTVHMFLTYTLIYFVLPRYLLKQKYWMTAAWFILLFLASAGMSALLSLTVIRLVRMSVLHIPGAILKRFTVANMCLALMAGFRGGITIGGIGATIKLMKYWYLKEKRNLQLQKENVEAQLQLLKAQVHPHFLFNTLNNIYSYTQDTSATASKLVMGLSDMLRYMLYECSQPLVPLKKEIKMLEDYIVLEKIRYDRQLDVHLDFPGDTDDYYISPLLLLPFVENCFKHGTSDMLEHPWISLHMRVENDILKMKLVNGKMPARPNHTPGIGILNARKRLALIYPGKHDLLVMDDEDVFVVNFTLEIARQKATVLKPVFPKTPALLHD